LLEIGDGVFEVIHRRRQPTPRRRHLDKGDRRLALSEFKKSQASPSADPMALQRLYEASEKAKIELSTTHDDHQLPFIHPITPTFADALRAQATSTPTLPDPPPISPS